MKWFHHLIISNTFLCLPNPKQTRFQVISKVESVLLLSVFRICGKSPNVRQAKAPAAGTGLVALSSNCDMRISSLSSRKFEPPLHFSFTPTIAILKRRLPPDGLALSSVTSSPKLPQPQPRFIITRAAMADNDNAFHGACSCGRNRYTIEVPQASSQFAQVFFDNSSSSRESIP
jgi:hypothetical protein